MAGNIDHRNNIMNMWNSGDQAGALAYMKSYFDGVGSQDAGHIPALLTAYNKANSSKLQADIDAYNTYVTSFFNGVGYPFSLEVVNAYGQKYVNPTYLIGAMVQNTGLTSPTTNPYATTMSGAPTATNPASTTTAKTSTGLPGQKTSGSALPYIIAGVLLVGGIIGLIIYKKKHKK